MKRRVLCIFGLLTWLLGLATFLSLRIEELMVPLVTVTEPAHPKGSDEGRLPLDCLFDGQLFQTFEGTGWEKGTRVRLADPAQYQVLEDHIEMNWGQVVEFATKTPRPGELVEVVLLPGRADDRWVVVPADDRPLPEFSELDAALTVEQESETAWLVSVKGQPQPYMEKRAQTMMPLAPVADDFSPWTGEDGEVDWESVDWEALEAARPKAPHIYSLTDVETALRELPKLGLLAGMVLGAVVLWVGCWGLSRNAAQHRSRLALLAGCMAALLVGSAFLISSMDLPSSLLPVNNIVEIGHYQQEFGQIFRALEGFAQHSGPAAELISLAREQTGFFWLALAGGGAAGGALSLGLWWVGRRQVLYRRARHARAAA